ncbi:MAG TPA: dihydrofolate reductase [Mycobacteriales bacterium]
MRALVWAQSADGVIGRDGALPWQLPEDMALFRALTAGGTVVMGRRTWESLPARFRPLPGRRNVVLTRGHAEGAEVIDDLGRAPADCWVIGGERVYAAALPSADLLVTTYVEGRYDGDAWAPTVDDAWQPITEYPWWRSSGGLAYTVVARVRDGAVRSAAGCIRALGVLDRHASDRA